MKKKLVLGAVALSALTLASCSTSAVNGGSISVNKGTNYTYDTITKVASGESNGNVDVYINYEGTSGITFRGTSWFNTVENKLYTQGALLPVWEEMGKVAGVNVREACGYKSTSNDNAFTSVATAGYKSEVNSSQSIDLFYNSTANLRTAGNSGSLVNLLDYLDQMPNLKAYLETDEGKAVLAQAKVNNKLYYTPYVDGTNDVRKSFIMDTTMLNNVLQTGKGDSDTVTLKTSYTKFIKDNAYEITYSVNGVAKKVTLANDANIIDLQNESIKNGCTGKQLADELIKYIKDRYEAKVPEYTHDGAFHPEDLFTSESACYNVDELIALMRVVKANPKCATGDKATDVQVFFPRGESSSAIESVYDLAQLWGVQGVDSSNGNYYFAADGTLNALETTQASYDALQYISQLYDEGLILSNYYTSSSMSSGTRYLDKYFKKTATDSEYGFMMYDDISIGTSANNEIDGLGTSRGKDSATSNTGFSPVLAPVTYWSTKGNSANLPITDTSLKSLTRYYESSRSLQTTSWAIPASSDNIIGALKMMDAMYSEYGQLVQNYGPTQYWAESTAEAGKVATDLVAGEKNAILSSYTKLELADSKLDYWSFMRGYLGAGHGVGHIRLNGANLQSVNYYGQKGLKNIQSAMISGALEHATLSTTYNWNVTVPTMFTTSVSDDKNAWDGITGFWAANKINKNEGWVNVVISASTASSEYTDAVIKTGKNGLPISWDKMKEQKTSFNQGCLYVYASSLGDATVPAYAKK